MNDRSDFAAFLREQGLHADDVERTKRLMMEPVPSPGVFVAPSAIEGLGAFAAKPFNRGEVLLGLVFGQPWTVVGRFANHSMNPNVEAKPASGGVVFVVLRAIAQDEEITVNYRSVKAALTTKHFTLSNQ